MGLYELVNSSIMSFVEYRINMIETFIDYYNKAVDENKLFKDCFKLYENASTRRERLLAIQVPHEIMNQCNASIKYADSIKYYILPSVGNETVYVRLEYQRGKKYIVKNLVITLTGTKQVEKFSSKVEMLLNTKD